MAPRFDWPEVLNGVKLAPSIQRKPKVPIRTSGTSFRTVVTTWTKPASATPRMLTSVSVQIAISATARLDDGEAAMPGKRKPT